MKHIPFLLIAALLTACSAPPTQQVQGQRWEKLDHMPSDEIIAALPPGVTVDDMIARYDPDRPGPCYYYLQYGARHPLVTPEMRKAGITNAPLCVEKPQRQTKRGENT
ncbi:hypothetical protein [Marimonas arenosa]|uniref:Lipoprotein n=1 Tax=Marimonas arenosa TaxID=1795305 RepID=A0AAE3W9H8_9RHOB|nr:hypothetical protein [Marimonas arenosa]MDQ2088841.1 hypothetical protein [Marimonas arenosa]